MTLESSVADSVGAMDWLEDADGALVELALSYARNIDDGGPKAMYLGPHLLATIRALGGTPGDRKALELEQETRGKLAELRAVSQITG